MATLAQLRERISDLPKYRYDTVTGDGTTTKYQVSKFPIEPSTGTVTVGGSVYGTAGYTLNGTSGILILGTAAANGTEVITEYNCTQLDGTTLSNILTRNGNVLSLSAAEALEMRAAGAAQYFSFISADVKIDKTKVADNYMRLAQQLRDTYYNPDQQTTVDEQIEWRYMDTEQDGD